MHHEADRFEHRLYRESARRKAGPIQLAEWGIQPVSGQFKLCHGTHRRHKQLFCITYIEMEAPSFDEAVMRLIGDNHG